MRWRMPQGLRRAVVRSIGLALLAFLVPVAAGAASLRFRGHGGSPGDDFVFPDRVKVAAAPPATANVGAGDFTIEFWMRASEADNPNPGQSCGFGIDWVNGNILIDRDRFNQGRKFGISLLGGTVGFGASSDSVSYTLCGTTNVLDLQWHHVAVERRASDGRMRIWVDGALDASGPISGGPDGDLSYPAEAVPGSYCSPDGGSGSESCANSDPFLVFGAEKHGFSGINYDGWLDEVRLSTVIRYTSAFTPPGSPQVPDADTAALYHFEEGAGSVAGDDGAGGSDGQVFFGGAAPSGPEWSSLSPFDAAPAVPALAALARLALAAALAAAAWAGSSRT